MHARHGGRRQHHREAQHHLRAPRHPRAGRRGLSSQCPRPGAAAKRAPLPGRARLDPSSAEPWLPPGASSREPSAERRPGSAEGAASGRASEPQASPPCPAGGRVITLPRAPAQSWPQHHPGRGSRPEPSQFIPRPQRRESPGGGMLDPVPCGPSTARLPSERGAASLNASLTKRSPRCPFGGEVPGDGVFLVRCCRHGHLLSP